MYNLRYMQMDDVPALIQIEAVSFPDSWSARSYYFEINESNVSHMVCLERLNDETAPPLAKPALSVWRRWLHWGRPAPDPNPTAVLLAYAGLWRIQEEAHISTIATAPQERRKGYGEILLLGMLNKALTLGAHYVVLEVRVSNIAAQALYHKHGFSIFETKPKYYHSDGEDAYDMRLDLKAEGMAERLRLAQVTAQSRLPHQDVYTDSPHPRLG
jgi:ribosomal-protein-alanine N-acetyltransferase